MKHLNLSDLINKDEKELDPDLAVIEGEEVLIITESDFMHFVMEQGDVKIGITSLKRLFGEPPRYVTLTRAEILARLGSEVDLPKWGHYWGIKSRVKHNYHLLLNSMREIGLDTSSMPDWNKR